MKLFTKIICVLMLSFTMFLMIGCESIKGPQGKYVFVQQRVNKCVLFFDEEDKVTITIEGEEKGTFDYTYSKSKDDIDIGTVTILSDDYGWVLEFNYDKKQLRYDYNQDGVTDVFIKLDQ